MNQSKLNRRSFTKLASGMALAPFLSNAYGQSSSNGKLLIIGGAEDRLNDRVILKKFVEVAGGPSAKLKFILTASSDPTSVWESYSKVFKELGATQVEAIPLLTREDANLPEVILSILDSDGIFMTGGDQSRLMAQLWETPSFQAIHQAFHIKGVCIAGTSAGAAVMSRQMIAQGQATLIPEKDVVSFDIGLGLVNRAIIDQHFSQRRRLTRLLSALAQRPDVLGVGIDENTGLLIQMHKSIEVIGDGSVTIVDGRRMISNYEEIESQEKLELLGVQLHLLPSGRTYFANNRAQDLHAAPSLIDAINVLVQPGPARI